MKNEQSFGISTFIGKTVFGLSAPVFFDPHYPISLNKPPVTLITGSPGSGKTFTAEILAGHSSVMNKLTYVIDPKGDFISLKKLERAGQINKTTIWSIFTNEDNAEINEDNYGMLDPFYLTKNMKDNVLIVIDVVTALMGEITTKQSLALLPIVQDVADLENPSLAKVVMELQRNQDDEIRSLGSKLGLTLDTSVAKLIVADKKATENPFANSEGLMIISLLGLSLPDAGTKEKDYTSTERLAAVIMQLLTQLILESMKTKPKKILKTLFIDEAWVVFGNKAGKRLIDAVALLGSSLNMATILATQSPAHLISGEEGDKRSSLDTTISTRFAFRNDSDSDNAINRKAMRLPENDGWEEVFPMFGTGQCMMKDCTGQISIIHTMTSSVWTEAFNTNPFANKNKTKKQ